MPENWKLVVAPHEVNQAHIRQVQDLFGAAAVLFSEFSISETDIKVLIIDNIGMLSGLYKYGEIAFIGGGFDKGGIHNILEPAVFGLPVIIGPVYEKFVEAREMVALKYAFPVNNAAEATSVLRDLLHDRAALVMSIKKHLQERTGATEKVMRVIAKILPAF